MEEKEVERQLKEDASKLKMKDFSERWEVIKDKIHPSGDGVHNKVLCEHKVMASTSGSFSQGKGIKKKLLFCSGLIILLIAVCLAIVLPITLRSKPQERFLGLADLERKNVYESDFNEAIGNADFQLIDLSKFELDALYILLAQNDKVMGGGGEVLDLETESYTQLMFYSSKVKSELVISGMYQVCTMNSVKIKYVTKFANDYYTTVAIADSGAVIYELSCMTGDENVTAVFERLFGND